MAAALRGELRSLIHPTSYEAPQSSSQMLPHSPYHEAMFSQTRFRLSDLHSGCLLLPPGHTDSPLGLTDIAAAAPGTLTSTPPPAPYSTGECARGREGRDRSPLTFLRLISILTPSEQVIVES